MFRPGWLEALRREAREETGEEVPESFVEFCAWIGVELRPGQRVVALVAYGGVDPQDLPDDERELARQLFGDIDEIPDGVREVINIAAGARAGKSYVLAALRLLHLALLVNLAVLAPGETAVGLIVAPTLKLARQTLGYVRGALGHPNLQRFVKSEAAESIQIQRDDEHVVSVECLAAGAKGAAVRGRSLVGAVLEEAAMFRDAETGVVNDAEIYRAVAPRVIAGGQVIIPSTPWAEIGLLWDLHKQNWGHPITALAIHAPTLLLRDDEHTRAYVAREEQRDPVNAAREFWARFMSGDATIFFDPRAIEEAAQDGLPRYPTDLERVTFGTGADFGFQRNSSTLAIVGRDVKDVYTTRWLDEVIPQGKVLKPSVVVKGFAAEVAKYGSDTVVADPHYAASIMEHLEEAHLYLQPAPNTAGDIAKAFVQMRTILHEGRLRIPNHPRLIRQLKEVTSKPLAGGAISIKQPEWKTGAHGDLVTALVFAVWQANMLGAPESTWENRDEPAPRKHRQARTDREARVRGKAGRIQRKLEAEENGYDPTEDQGGSDEYELED